MMTTVLALLSTLAASPAPPATDDAGGAAIARAVKDAADRGEFSGAVLVARGGRVLHRGAAGLASREAGTPNTPETKFNLGSINKAFTRLAVEQLAAEGKLALADPIGKHVAGLPEATGRVTLAQLLEHRGGTGDVFGPRYDATDRARLRELRDWLPLFASDPLEFEPGTRQRYSNAGYILLGLAIEAASGRPYHEHVHERIFKPAGMTDTGAFAVDADVPHRATGYTKGSGAWTDNRSSLPWRGTSAGGGYSTVDDLRRFADALRAGRLGGRGASIAIAGGAPGINAALEMEGGDTIAVMANLDPPAATRLAGEIRALLGHADDGTRRRVVRAGAGPTGPMAAPEKTVLPAGGVTVPMRRHGHMPAVEVLVDGKGPFLFAIDTGAAGVARIDAGLAERLGLPTVGEVRGGDPSGRNAQTMPVVAIGSIGIGGARFETLHAAVRDMKALPKMPDGAIADGILGFGLFAECLLTLDYPGAVVRVERGEVPASDPGAVAFTLDRGVPTIPITVAGRTFASHVDSGFRGGLSLPDAEAARLPLSAAPAVVGRAQTVSNTFEIKAAPLDGDAAIGPIVLSRPTLEFQPLFPHANVGAKVLGDLVVTFDQRNARIRMAKAAR